MKFLKAIRYGSLGVMASGTFVAIQGCDYKDTVIGLLALIALLLGGSGGGREQAHIAVLEIQANVEVDSTFVSQTVTMQAVVTNPDQVSSYRWDFGDGGSGSGQTVTHIYTVEGTYQVSVVVTVDNSQETLTTTLRITRNTLAEIVLFSAGGHDGRLGGRSGADNLCRAARIPAGVDPSTVHAFLSVSGTDQLKDMPTTFNFPDTGVKVIGPTGTSIADDWADIFDFGTDNLHTSFRNTAVTQGALSEIWTGSTQLGEALNICSGWTNNTNRRGRVGLDSRVDSTAIDNTFFFCFSDVPELVCTGLR